MIREITPFEAVVYAACRKIPRGRLSTYTEISKFIGKPKSARAVGNALNKNPFAPKVPCHRVVRSDGTVGGFTSGEKEKIKILRQEKIAIKNGRVADFPEVFWRLS